MPLRREYWMSMARLIHQHPLAIVDDMHPPVHDKEELQIYNYLTEFKIPTDMDYKEVARFKTKTRQYKVLEDSLFKLCNDGMLRLVVPFEERISVLKQFHDEACGGGHFSQWSTSKNILRG